MRLAIGVMGSSSEQYADQAWEKMVELGRAVAERGCALLTGACPSLPYAAVLGARQVGGLVVGISP
jgi:predicted Rossmann-fold nucleotide-binding protein